MPRGTDWRRGALVLVNWLNHLLLAVGLFAPCMTITPRMEPHTGLARWLGLLEDPETYSILTGILRLMRTGNLPIGLVLLVFSVLFPVAKLVVLRVCFHDARRGRPISPAHRVVAMLGKFSMVDVFVIALIVIVSKAFPGGTTVEIRWGAYAFALAALLSIPVSAGVARETPTLK